MPTVCLQIRTIAIIAEGIPENLTRKLIQTANEKGVTIIGPATVSRQYKDGSCLHKHNLKSCVSLPFVFLSFMSDGYQTQVFVHFCH